jgi:hypothetical protein
MDLAICAPMSSAVPTRTLTPRSVFAARPDVGNISAFTRVFDALRPKRAAIAPSKTGRERP